MITWKQQRAAVVGALELADGRRASVALVGPRINPKGAAIIVKAAESGSVDTVPLADAIQILSLEQIVDIICMQERIYGDSGLASPLEPVKGQ